MSIIKAINEHKLLNPNFPALEEGESTPLLPNQEGLEFSHQFADDIGSRKTMEDAHFYIAIDQGILAGVFDGHGGRAVADYASQQFKSRFSAALKDNNGDVKSTFTNLINVIQLEISDRIGGMQGSAAVITFIDKATNTIYTATLGDCEANQYRKNGNGEMRSIPLSLVRDWGSKNDAKRLETTLGLEEGAVAAHLAQHPKDRKHIRSRGIRANIGVNVSRAFGDASEKAVSQKPKFTESILQKGDIVVLACDGLKDFVPEEKIAQVVEERAAYGEKVAKLEAEWQKSSNIFTTIYNLVCRLFFYLSNSHDNIAETLVNTAPDNDNVTVLVINTK